VLETQRRVVDGVEHVLCSRDGRAWTIEVRVVRGARRRGGPGSFVYSFDGDAKVRTARVETARGVARVRAPVPAGRRFGVLEGTFASDGAGGEARETVLPFSFAVPDIRTR